LDDFWERVIDAGPGVKTGNDQFARSKGRWDAPRHALLALAATSRGVTFNW